MRCEPSPSPAHRQTGPDETTMVLFALQMKAALEGVRSVTLKEGTSLCLSVRNPSSDYEVRDDVIIDDIAEYLDAASSDDNKNEMACHLRLKWEGNPKAAFLKILTPAEAKTALKKSGGGGGHKKNEGGGMPRAVTADDDSDTFVTILLCECRGLEPYKLTAGSTEFVVVSEGGTIFDDGVNVADGDWADYDADHDAPVALSEVQFQWRAV
jgi:hypothetical protein